MKAQPRPSTDMALIVIEKDLYYTLPIEGWPDYHASTCGNIVSTKNNEPIVLSPLNNGTGYNFVRLSNGNLQQKLYIHRLVAQTFLESPSDDAAGTERTDINHIDSDRTNNKLANLEWCSRKENMIHAYTLGRLNKELEAVANV